MNSSLPSGLNFEKLLSSLVDVICVCEAGGLIHYISTSVWQMLGYTAEEMTHRSCPDFVHPADIGKTCDLLKAKKVKDQVSTFEYRLRKKDGTMVPLVWLWRWNRVGLYHQDCFSLPCLRPPGAVHGV